MAHPFTTGCRSIWDYMGLEIHNNTPSVNHISTTPDASLNTIDHFHNGHKKKCEPSSEPERVGGTNFVLGTKVSMYFCKTGPSLFSMCGIPHLIKPLVHLTKSCFRYLDRIWLPQKWSISLIPLFSGELVRLERSRAKMAVSTQLGLLLWKNLTCRRRQTVSLNTQKVAFISASKIILRK